jgi:hypothetical protein
MGIEHELTIPYEHEQAGLAESMNCVIIDKARTMLISKEMDLKFWPDAVQTAVFVANRCGTMAVKVSHMKNSPEEKQMLKCYMYFDLGAGLDNQQNIYWVATSLTNEEYYAKCLDTNNTATHIVYLMLNPAKYSQPHM